MSDESQTLSSFTAFHDAIKAQLETIPNVREVALYDANELDKVTTPAILVELGEIDPSENRTGGRLAVNVDMRLHCLLSVQTERVQLEVRNFAAVVMMKVDKNRFGLGRAVENPTRLSAFPGMFKPDEKGFESWVVNYTQTVHLGAVWEEADFLPTEIYLGQAPDIGLGHENDYIRLNDE